MKSIKKEYDPVVYKQKSEQKKEVDPERRAQIIRQIIKVLMPILTIVGLIFALPYTLAISPIIYFLLFRSWINDKNHND